MIINFACSKTEKVFNGEFVPGKKFIPKENQEDTRDILVLLNSIEKIQDLWLIPSLKPKKIQGTADMYELRVNKRYRIFFEWEAPNAYNVKASDHL